MRLKDFIELEWRPALGCTEPASIAYAAASAAALAQGRVVSARLVCDPRIYKNCYAVGIPHSEGKTGILWALALGCLIPDPGARLECFRETTPAMIAEAERLIRTGAVSVDVDITQDELLVDCRVNRAGGTGRAVIAKEHARLVLLERDGVPLGSGDLAGSLEPAATESPQRTLRAELAAKSFAELIALAEDIGAEEARALRDGVALNQAISTHGLTLLPTRFIQRMGGDALTRLSCLVLSGVHARMTGEDFVVMSLAGSGNKGITCSVPLLSWGEEQGFEPARIDCALALALLVTSATTHHLGTLSAVCGCSNAAGIGLAAGLVYLEGGDGDAISLAMNNMVGNVTGMICDGAKIGCALKTMTSVDAAFRAASLAMNGIGIPASDGIIGDDGLRSLENLGRIAQAGMTAMDPEILSIMQDKLRRTPLP